MVPNKGLVLFTRLPDYFYQCLKHFCRKYNFHCTVVVYPGDSNTSFVFQSDEFLTIINRSDLNFDELLSDNFQFVYTGSWRDKDYKKICKHFKSTRPVIIGMDNPWTGNWKQWINVFISSITIRPFYNKIWVAGKPQFVYARKLGFKTNAIFQGLYSADTKKFLSETNSVSIRDRSILFLGRFVEYKHPVMLARVFKELLNEHPELNGWKLIFTGRGPQSNELQQYSGDSILIKDFVSPENLPDLLQNVSVFCLPSENEHWGVVVHEAACSGVPLLLSDTVMASSEFLHYGKNGYSFKSGSQSDLKLKLKKMMTLSLEQISSMGNHSRELGQRITLDSWSDTLYKMSVVNGFE